MFSSNSENGDNHGVVTIYDNWLKEDLPYSPPKLSMASSPKQAWSPENMVEVKQNAWRDQIEWTLWGLRACLRFPYSTNSKGELEIKYISYSFLYWITAYTLYVALTVYTVWSIFNKILTEPVDTVQIMVYMYNMSVCLYSITYPGSLVKEFKTLAKSINRWPEFEELCRTCLRKPIQLENMLSCKLCSALIIPFCTLLIYGVSDLVFAVHWINYFVKVMVASSVCYMLTYWVLSVEELINIGEQIRISISEDLCSLEEKNVGASRIRDLRTVWIELTALIKLNADSWSYIFAYLALTVCIVIIMSSFAAISILVNENRFDFGLLYVVMSASGVSYFMFEYGHRLTKKVGYEICEALGNVNILHMDKAAKEEIKFFTKVAKMNYPTVTLGGIFVANRAAMTSMIAAVITNLIVILQLPKSMSLIVQPTNTSNYTGDPIPDLANMFVST